MATFPETWWTKHPLIIAHRGANRYAPENTLSAFRKAIEIGADGIELDVRLTADNIPVILHDSRLESTTDGHGIIYDLSLKQVKALKIRSSGMSSSLETVPTLEEVLDDIGGETIVNIELKGSRRKDGILVKSVCDLLKKKAVENYVWFSSFKPRVLRQTRKFLPTVPNGFLYVVQTKITSLRMTTIPCESVHPYFPVINHKYVKQMHKEGKRVVVWTVDNVKIAEQCIEADVDMIITNEPEKIIRIRD